MKIKYDSLVFWVSDRYCSWPSVILNIAFAPLIVRYLLINLEVDWIDLWPSTINPINEVLIIHILVIVLGNQ
jgi:hypothetical protein